jgi:N-acetylated-alpha-linked acidic dipeptidase
VHLRLEFDWSLRPAHNVIARLPGATYPDEWIIRGNHHDAWVFGAADPLSGMVALLDEARAIGRLARDGHRPKRTIVFAAWDAEEPGLLGSTEWVEDHADELRRHAVAYINTDGNSRGFLGAGGSHALERLVNEVAREVTDPQYDVPVWERRRARMATGGDVAPDETGDLPISPLGSGSDYTPFLQHMGVATLNIGFGGEGGGGSYHSAYDSYDHFSRFRDPGFVYGATLSRTTGRLTLRLANADVLPFRFSNLASHVKRYLDEVTKLADDLRERTARENALVEKGSYRLAADPTEPFVAPDAKDEVPYLNLAPVQNAVTDLEAAAKAFDAMVDSTLAAGDVSPDVAGRLNQRLLGAERLLTDDAGLPRRPWFRHQIYAPGFYTGYGVKTLPGIRESIEERDWAEVDTMVARVSAALNRLSEALEGAAGM